MSVLATAAHPAGRRPTGTRRRKRASPRRRPGRGRKSADVGRWLPIVLVGLAVLAGLAWGTEDAEDAAERTDCTVAGVPLTAEQMTNAAVIAEVGRDRSLPDRAIVIALATAMQESRLRNLDYGDRDSLGLFQQRPSQGWGTESQVQDPVYAAGIFYDRLVQVPGWVAMPLGAASDAVQRSAYPERVPPWEPMATQLAAGLVDPAALDCG